MTKTSDAIASQAELLNEYSQVVKNLIQLNVSTTADRDKALAQVATLLRVDEATAAAILANNPHIQSLIDQASAAIPPESLPVAS